MIRIKMNVYVPINMLAIKVYHRNFKCYLSQAAVVVTAVGRSRRINKFGLYLLVKICLYNIIGFLGLGERPMLFAPLRLIAPPVRTQAIHGYSYICVRELRRLFALAVTTHAH